MIKRSALLATMLLASPLYADDLDAAVERDYDDYLAGLFDHFHRNPELSTVEFKTAERMTAELRAAGFEVTEKVGGTGIVAMLENGAGPLVMMRADMDGLPVKEKSGLDYASSAQQKDPITGNEVFTMHACGHDVHITSLVGTARQMVARRGEWQGTLMLVVQLTVRNTNEETRTLLLDGIRRIAENMGRVAGLPEDRLPEVIVSDESEPPTSNNAVLTRRLKTAWSDALGDHAVVDIPTKGMGAEDFPFFSTDPNIPSVYWAIGGTPQADFAREAAGGPPVPSHHSPLFKVAPEPSIRAGVESTVVALMALMAE